MAHIQPRTVAGTLELLPEEQMIFQFMIDTIRRGFERFGFVAIETPIFEHRDVLLTKSGGETEKQVYFVQSTGALQQGHDAEMALHFDLTVPLARYVAEHERDLAFPFRRYQIQRVYRGERPQKGRFREFYQCDIDVIGKDQLNSAIDAELPAIIVSIFQSMGIPPFTLYYNNRKLLRGLLEGEGVLDSELQKLVLREIDKLDKIDKNHVQKSLEEKGLSQASAQRLLRFVTAKSDTQSLIDDLKREAPDNPSFKTGLEEVILMQSSLKALGISESLCQLNLAIARGLDYYTGTVYETLVNDHPDFGSICSGGRYDDLASFYTKSKLPGVGISIGLTRLFDQLRTHHLLPKAPHTLDILLFQIDQSLRLDILSMAQKLRQQGLNVETYIDTAKLDKQFKYADKSGIPFALLYGPDEKMKDVVIIKDLRHKTQTTMPFEKVADYVASQQTLKRL